MDELVMIESTSDKNFHSNKDNSESKTLHRHVALALSEAKLDSRYL